MARPVFPGFKQDSIGDTNLEALDEDHMLAFNPLLEYYTPTIRTAYAKFRGNCTSRKLPIPMCPGEVVEEDETGKKGKKGKKGAAPAGPKPPMPTGAPRPPPKGKPAAPKKRVPIKTLSQLQDSVDDPDDDPSFDPKGVSVVTGKPLVGWI